MTQLYATVKKRSRYYRQNEFEGRKPVPFPVQLAFESDPNWPVKGGLGGQYTLWDVDLWVQRHGGFMRIPMHVKP